METKKLNKLMKIMAIIMVILCIGHIILFFEISNKLKEVRKNIKEISANLKEAHENLKINKNRTLHIHRRNYVHNAMKKQ